MTSARCFSHRFNPDSTVDSICHRCFATVATERSESNLHLEERLHSCHPGLIERYSRATWNSHDPIQVF
jgi:hypothetical protein